jgi:hypothetical protein
LQIDNEAEFWPEGLSGDSDLCSKYWLPKVAESMLDSVFQVSGLSSFFLSVTDGWGE